MYCGSKEDLNKIVDAVLTHRCARRNIIEWTTVVGVLILVSLAVVWMTTRRPHHVFDSPHYKQPDRIYGEDMKIYLGSDAAPVKMSLLHEEPCIRMIENFMSADECESLVSIYKNSLTPSTVSARDDKHEGSSSRTSTSAFLPAGSSKHPILASVERRLVLMLGVPISHWETLQLTRYQKGQEYKPHFDWFDSSSNNRAATVFVYLNDVPENYGGQTEFTSIGLSVQPKCGNALVWFNCSARGESVVCDTSTRHAGMPPTDGEKYGLNCWARTAPYRTR